MEHSSRVKVLRQLARTGGEIANKAIENEATGIAASLAEETRFDILEQQLELLDEIGFREPDRCIQIIQQFLERLDVLELTFKNELGLPTERILKYQNKEGLTVQALNVLDRIRYFQVANVLEIFVSYYLHSDGKVRNKAAEYLERVAEYDINIFYSGEGRAGLGPAPQVEIIDWMEALSAEQLNIKAPAVIELCVHLLSPTMSGTTGDYKTITWSSGAIPAMREIADIRSRSLRLLKKIYGRATTIAEKLAVINSMLAGTHVPHEKHDDDVVQMISRDTVEVLNFFKQIVPDEDLQIVQKIEHEAFWSFYHASTNDVRTAALEIRDLLAEDHEYEIYRNLIGFEGVFEDWEKRLSDKHDFSAEEEHRSSKALEYADKIDNENWGEWSARILRFCQTESNDLATFPHFYEFLNRLAAKSPELALDLLRNHPEEIGPFIIPMFRGLWNGSRGEEFRAQVLEWIEGDQWLPAIAKVFLFKEVKDKQILEILTAKAMRESLQDVLVRLVGVATARYAEGDEEVVQNVFLPAVEKLTTLGNADWVFDAWHRTDRKSLLADLDKCGREIVLNNLILAKKIDYHSEDLLVPLAETDPAQVLNFFRDRQAFEEEAKRQGDYDAIPYAFHKLNEALAQFPDIAVDTVRSWFDGSDPLFQYRGANLLKNIFPSFPEEFSTRLIALVCSGEKENVEFVLSVLRNYQGENFLYDICREIVLAFPNDDDARRGVQLVLLSTGVVSGEFGFAEAYEQKIEQIKPWLTDECEPVRKFASNFTESLKLQAEHERERAEEDIELRKHMYGVREESEKSSDGTT